MKKINLKSVKPHEFLSREELKQIMGGFNGSGSGSVSPNESVAECTARVYKAAKDACDADDVCKTACDIIPTCVPSMVAAAAIACAIN